MNGCDDGARELVAAIRRWHGPDVLTDAEQAAIAELVAQAPPMTEAQRGRIGRLLSASKHWDVKADT